jgi:hypothetical protein
VIIQWNKIRFNVFGNASSFDAFFSGEYSRHPHRRLNLHRHLQLITILAILDKLPIIPLDTIQYIPINTPHNIFRHSLHLTPNLLLHSIQ